MTIENQARSLANEIIWPTPQPLLGGSAPAAYPLDALPDAIKAAVLEVFGFVQAPLPMVVCSALTALSIAAQSRANIERATRLTGPCSIFALTIAVSGERKSTLDGYFLDSLREWEANQQQELAGEIADYNAALAAWEAKRSGLIENIKQAAKKELDTTVVERDLVDLERDRPTPPRVPRVLLADETPEALAFSLAKHWPSAGIVSSEAGTVFGGHAMGSDSIMRNLALLNVLWDGAEHSTGRRSKESFTVRDARLTVSLQVQPEALRQFFAKAGPLARGSGFLARFLIAWPESTQGTRLYCEPPDRWPALERFNGRIREILDAGTEIRPDGGLDLPMTKLDLEAKECWRKFHDDIEVELRSGGELVDVRDVASKTADNAARIACLFHVFLGRTGPVTVDVMKSSALVAAWHLQESRRFFDEIATPAHVRDAIDLEHWLVERCRSGGADRIRTREIQRHVTPSRLRKNPALADAIGALEDADRARLIEEGKQKWLEANPRLLRGVEDGLA